MPTWRRNQGSKTRNQDDAGKLDGTGTVRPWALEVDADISVVEDAEPVVG
jgi:hypothetical protein